MSAAISVGSRCQFTAKIFPSVSTGRRCVVVNAMEGEFDWMIEFFEDRSHLPVAASELTLVSDSGAKACEHPRVGLAYRYEMHCGILFRDWLECPCGAQYSLESRKWTALSSDLAPEARGEQEPTSDGGA